MLKTAGGVIGNEETYDNAANIVTLVINPRRAGQTGAVPLGWIVFSCTYTFSGMKRPGAALVDGGVVSQPQGQVSINQLPINSQMPSPVSALSDAEIEELHQMMLSRRQKVG